MKKFEELKNMTSVEWEGKELRTTQDPYVGDNGDIYKAHAIDANCNEYQIIWEVIDEIATDESEACDWDRPVDVVKL